MSWVYRPAYRLEVFKASGYGRPTSRGAYALNTLIRADWSLMTANGVGEASIQVSDVAGGIKAQVDPQPMDVLRLWSNSRLDPTLRVVWTGFLDSITVRYDPQNGQSLVLAATTPYKLWDVTTQALNPPNASDPVNDTLALGLASLRGIAARDLITATARAVGYPGALAGVHPNPGGLQLYQGPEYIGQLNFSLPDNAASEPDLQTYAAIVTGLANDTGMELYWDEYGSLVFRPIGYLNVPQRPYTLTDDDIIEAELTISDQQVQTQVRVRWGEDYNYNMDGFAPQATDGQLYTGVQAMQRQIGTRTLIIDAPWIITQDAANFLAKSLLQQFAAGVATAVITIPANPAIRVGTVIRVPSLQVGGGSSYYYVLQKVGAYQYNAAWLETLTLAYGRDPTQSFPYIGVETRPVLTNQESRAWGIPQRGQGQLSFTPAGALASPFVLVQDTSLGANEASAPFPVGTILRINDPAGNPIVDGPDNGEYLVTNTSTDATIHIHTTHGVTSTSNVYVVQFGTAADTSTTRAPTATTQTNTPSTPQMASGAAFGTMTSFSYFPLAGYKPEPFSQAFGPTVFAAEPSYPYRGPTDTHTPPRWVHGQTYAHFHTGVDIPAPTGTPIRAPVTGTITTVGWDPQGFGNYTVLTTSAGLQLWFGHQSQINVRQGDSVQAGAIIGQVGSTGNSTGPHLHFGVWDPQWNSFVDPEPYLLDAQNS